MNARQAERREAGWLVLIPVSYALLVTVYTALRYGYRWAETDTGAFMRLTRRILETETIQPVSSAYPNGYGYQTLVIVLADVTGLSAATLQVAVLPFLSVVIALTAFIAMRLLMGSAILGALAALLLFIQPEFLFVIQRGNHEKVTYLLVLIMVFLIGASILRQHTPASLAGVIVAYYLSLWTLISVNSFFASSVVAALGLSLAGGALLLLFSRRQTESDPAMRRLVYTFLASVVLVTAFIAFIYRPAEHTLLLYRQLIDQIAVLVVSAEPTGDPYGGRSSEWVAPWVYPVLTAYNWLVLAASILTWVWLALEFLRTGIQQSKRHVFVLWLLVGAFALQIVAGAVIDLAGFLSANLQVRLFPLYMLFGIPLAVIGAARIAPHLPRLARPAAAAAATAALLVFAVTGVLKATNDPLVSNKWLFFTQSEEEAVGWVDQAVTAQNVWIGLDERLRMMQDIHQPPDPERLNSYGEGAIDPSVRYLVISEVSQRESLRRNAALPNVAMEDRIYDNGSAWVYHRVPETPYQP